MVRVIQAFSYPSDKVLRYRQTEPSEDGEEAGAQSISKDQKLLLAGAP